MSLSCFLTLNLTMPILWAFISGSDARLLGASICPSNLMLKLFYGLECFWFGYKAIKNRLFKVGRAGPTRTAVASPQAPALGEKI